MATTYDLVVLGSGPGGYVAAIRAGQLGLKTACIERAELGGICLNWGCIPTKALLHSAGLYQEMQKASQFGITAPDVGVDFAGMIKHSRQVSERLSKGVEFLFRKNKIETVYGSGKISVKSKIEVAGSDGKKQVLETKNILIATGARPRTIPGVELDGKQVITSKEAMVLPKQPKKMVIIGAGAIGVEFAYFYRSIGTEVVLVEMMPQILPIEDKEVAEVVNKSFAKQGIQILAGAKVTGVEKGKGKVKVKVEQAGAEQELSGDVVLMAIGVQGNVEGIGLETVGVKVKGGWIEVDRRNYRTSVEGIYAIGDVIGPPWLAHVASAEGVVAAETIAGEKVVEIDYDNIPGCTYCQPQVASLGLTEERAKEAGYEIKVGRFPFRANGKSLAMGHSEGFAKLIFDARYGELLGAHIVGAEATEMMAELGVARTLETTADELMRTVHAHPTLTEVIKEAAEDAFGRAIHI
ncbi:dihydrolipoyl dehydrogenase [candidate division KSB1 bacterium RBG_16_48_16]|nr:MAG: dihydrolipoyl dehydrogenase [candidate division KSB1 bacterium RBG_16_48_16]